MMQKPVTNQSELFLWFLVPGSVGDILWELTYPFSASTFEDDCPFPKVGYVSFLVT